MSCNESPSSKRQKTLRAEPRIKLISENIDQSSECLDDGEDVREGKSESMKDSSKLINISTKSNSEGDTYWELSTQRRITVRSFKGNVLVDIREMYEKNGKALPGKKGISLTEEQYAVLHKIVQSGAIENEIKKSKRKL